METKLSAKIRDYAIAGTCIVLAILAVIFFPEIFVFWDFGKTPANIWSECRNDSVNIFIGANENLRDVKCIAHDRDLFDNPEIIIGDLSMNSKDVCKFRLKSPINTTKPLGFEVHYSNEVNIIAYMRINYGKNWRC